MKTSMRPPLVFRGSRQRLRRIRFRDNWSAEMSYLAVVVVVALCLVVRWLWMQGRG